MQSNTPAPDTTAANVGVITVSYGSGPQLDTFLASLRRHETPELPIIVVDNKPDTENVADIADRYGARYLPLPLNPGYGAGMNAGVHALRSQFPDRNFTAYFFCNPDLRLIEPIVEGLAQQLAVADHAGSIGPKLLNVDGSVYPSARNIPSISTGIGHALFSRVWPTNPWTQRYQVGNDSTAMRAAGSLSGAAVMTSRGAYERIGGWDEAYFLHFEDIDLGWRIGNLGLTNLYAPHFSVEHSGAHSTVKHAAMVERAQTASAIRFLEKRYSGWANAPLRAVLKLGLRARLIWKLRTH